MVSRVVNTLHCGYYASGTALIESPPDSARYKNVPKTPSLQAPHPPSSGQTTAPLFCGFNSHCSSSRISFIGQISLHHNVTRQLFMWYRTLRNRHLRRTSDQGEMAITPVIANTANPYSDRLMTAFVMPLSCLSQNHGRINLSQCDNSIFGLHSPKWRVKSLPSQTL